jgi:putative aldouronate transport system substrate-binding protein
MYLYQSKILFEEKDASNWPKYRQELMNKYGGKQIFDYYAEQITKAHSKTYTFKADN